MPPNSPSLIMWVKNFVWKEISVEMKSWNTSLTHIMRTEPPPGISKSSKERGTFHPSLKGQILFNIPKPNPMPVLENSPNQATPKKPESLESGKVDWIPLCHITTRCSIWSLIASWLEGKAIIKNMIGSTEWARIPISRFDTSVNANTEFTDTDNCTFLLFDCGPVT